MMRCASFLSLLVWTIATASAQIVFINEIHYDNQSTDTGEAVEIVAPAGTDLSAYELLFYNGANGNTYGSLVLSGTTPNQGNSGFGAIAFPFEGIQNGAPDGIALLKSATNFVVQFLSYEGEMSASGGPASGVQSEDIGVSESASTVTGTSLQLTGDGSDYSDFIWTRGSAATFGTINVGQTLDGAAVGASITLTLSRNRLVESSATTSEVRIQFSPAPQDTADFSIKVSRKDDLSAPARVTVDDSGIGSFTVSAIDNAVDDGDRTVDVTVTDSEGEESAIVRLTIVDDDRMPLKGEAVRVAAFNLLNDVGDRGSAGFNAVASSLSRIEPDVIAFQEVDSINGFQPLKLLLEDIALPTDAMHFATVDDAFTGEAYNGGDFNSGEQSLAIASRYPIKRVVQIGRDVPDGRREITRFPLYAEIDIPWAEDADDLHVICVHYKAGTRDSDRFRKVVEAYRTLEFLEAEGISADTHNVVILGDFNENIGNFQPSAFNTGRRSFGDGSSFPNGFAVGDDISGADAITLDYDTFPTNLFGLSNYSVTTARHSDRRGINTFIVAEGVRLDYIILSDRLYTNGNRFTEVFNSEVDVDFEGIPKQGVPVDAGTSKAASDHFPLFGDYWLEPRNRITVSFSTASPALDEGSDMTVTASIVLTPAPDAGQEVMVQLSDPSGDLELPPYVIVIGPANSSEPFEVGATRDGRADRSRSIALVAEADGYATGYGGILVRNRNASGRALISQMLHTTANGGVRAIEVTNASSERIQFSDGSLELRFYFNGSASSGAEIVVRQGGLDPGESLVLGNSAFAEIAGEGLELLEERMDYDGNDAIELLIGGVRSDLFGRIEDNPGSAWQSGEISTRNANLKLKGTIGIGSSGWSDPSLRFKSEAALDSTGFGEAPALADPYVSWIETFGMERNGTGHPDADGDEDGLTNASEFGFFTLPVVADRFRTVGPMLSRNPTFVRRRDDGRVIYRLATSRNLVDWSNEGFFIQDSVSVPDGKEQVTVQSLLRILRSENYFRMEAELP
ncbi:MAG: endonuclease/exonuclease/phosphatase family metal-dependent hydrolase [Verrucomicrobiales bacterium]|jgi:endonuclease/exonuclease/phosphatase family metal-dependent hydrolase